MGNLVKANFIVGFLSGAVVSAGIMVIVFGFPLAKNSTNLSGENMQSTPRDNQSKVNEPVANSIWQDNRNLLNSKEEVEIGANTSTPAPDRELTADCDELCVKTLVDKFIGEAGLTSEDWDSIKDHNDSIAAAIASNPAAVDSLRDKISYSSDAGEIDGLLTIVSSFPDNVGLEVINDVASYSNTHKALALQTLGGMSVYSQDAAREIENLIIGARDPQVISAALTALETTDNYAFNPETWQSLSNQFPYVEDPQLKGSILVSLAKHGKGDLASLRNNVEAGLSSQSSDLQGASIEALRYLVSRSEDNGRFTSTEGSAGGDLKSKLSAIADNSAAETSLRIDALRLLDEAF